MANDRLVIVCRTCRVGKAFAKWLGDWYAISDCEARLDDFMRRHQCCGNLERPWELVYENDRDGAPWAYEQVPAPDPPPGWGSGV